VQAPSLSDPVDTDAAAPAPCCAPGFTVDETRAWFGLLHSSAHMTRELDADLVAAHGLPLNAFEVLMRVSHADGGQVRMTELARQVVLSLSGLSRLVDRLEREGLLTRESCSADARGAFAKLTPAGERKLAEARATHLAGVRALFLHRLSPVQQELLGEVWDAVLPGA
jgi:DNA-binding MarR family transcriptional regulator